MSQESLPKLLVIAGYPPEKGAGGGVILRGILNEYPGDKLAWFNLNKFRDNQRWWRTDISRGEPNFGIRGLRHGIIRKLYLSGGFRINAMLSVIAARRFIDAWRPDIVWFVLDYDTVFVCQKLMGRKNVPFHISVHDDPLITSEMIGYKSLVPEIASAFEYCWRHASSRDCVSEGMAELYLKNHGVPSNLIVRRGVDQTRIGAPSTKAVAESPEIKLFMGGDTAVDQGWPNSVLAAIEQLKKRGRNVVFHGFDRRIKASSGNAVFYDQMPEPEFDRLLRTMHIGYAADPITDIGRRFAMTSFPTKIITYIGAGLPFIYHGPRISAVGTILERYRAGVVVEGDSASEISDAIERVIANYGHMQDECLRAAREEFNLGMFRSKLFDMFTQDVSRAQ